MLLKIGQEFSCWYPSHNKIGVPLEWVRRHILVTDVRDFSPDRLAPADFLERPLLRRGSLLIYGTDLDLGQPRKLYLDACRGHDLPTFRLGLYFPDDTLIDWIGREYEPTRRDRVAMYEEVQRFGRWLQANPKSEMRLGIYRGEAA